MSRESGGVAALRHSVRRGGVRALRARAVPPQELRHGLHLQGLQQEDLHDQLHSHAHAGPCQGVAQVS